MQDGTAVYTGSGHVSAAAGVPGDEVLAGLGKVQCLRDSASLTGCALRGLAAIGRGEEPDVKAAPTATSLVELGCLLRDAGGALLERAGLLHGQPERGEVCAALHFLSFRCFCAVDVLHQAASGTGVDALPEGDALWGPILGAWLGVRGGGGLEGALADLTRWWISYKVHAVERVGARAAMPPSDSGTSGMADALTSMRQQAEWLRGEAADELKSEVAAGHLESAAAAVEQLRSMVGSSKIVAARRLRPVSGMEVLDGVQCFESGTVHVLQIQEGLTPTFNTGREEVDHWSSNVAAGTEAVASSVAALMRGEDARLVRGLPLFAQSVRGAAMQHIYTGATWGDPMGSSSSVLLQLHCEAGWPLSQVVNDEAWGDVGRTVRQKLCRAVLGTCAAATACGVDIGGVGLDSFVLVGAESSTVSGVAAAVESGSCQVLLGACSGVWAESHEAGSCLYDTIRDLLGVGGSGPVEGVFVSVAEDDFGLADVVLDRMREGGRSSCMEAYAALCHAEVDFDNSDLAGADAVVRGNSGAALSTARGEPSMSPFVVACKAGNVSKVRQLLAQSGDAAVDVHAGDGNGPEAGFRLACEHGHVDVVSELLGLEDDRAVDVWSGSSWDESRDMEMLYTGSNVSAVRGLLSARHSVSEAAEETRELVAVSGKAVRTAMLSAQIALIQGKANTRAAESELRLATEQATASAEECRSVYSYLRRLAQGGQTSALDVVIELVGQKQRGALDVLASLVYKGDSGAMEALASHGMTGGQHAIDALKSMAEGGNVEAQVGLGHMYKDGKGVEIDFERAVWWYRAAAEQGDPEGLTSLAIMYTDGLGVEKDPTEAVRLHRAAAEQGDVDGLFNLGTMYAHGLGVEKDETVAAQWFRAAAEQGDANGQCNLGVMHAIGRGVQKDEAEAERWFRAAAEQGHSHAQHLLGSMYLNGLGVEKDEAEAVRWFRASAVQGDPEGQCLLGNMYRIGSGVGKDGAEAERWFRAAADQGHVEGQFSLGIMYAEGTVVERDDAEAARWFRAAAEQGCLHSVHRLAEMYKDGKGVDKDEAEAVRLYRGGAEQGFPPSQHRLAEMYMSGRGVERDAAKAMWWYEKAQEGLPQV